MKQQKIEKKSKVSTLFETLGGLFKPILSIMIASGIIQAVRDILVLTGTISTVSSSYIFLNAIGDCVFYFLPIWLAFSAASIFGTSPYMSAAIAGFLVYPAVTDLFNWSRDVGWNLTFFGFIPVTYAKYTSSVLPILLIVWVQSYVEKFARKIIPDLLKTIFVPVVVMFVCCFLGLTVLGPIGTWIGDGLSALLRWLSGIAPWLVPTLVGAFSPFLVLTGSHYSLFPVATNNLATLGYDTVLMVGNLTSNMALAGISFAAAVRAKNRKYKSYSASAGITALFGIGQSSLYGVAIPLKKPLYAAVIGGGVGGFVAGITRIKCYSFMTPGLLSLIGYFKPEAGIGNFIFAILSVLVGFVVAFIACLLLGFEEPDAATINELAGVTTTADDAKLQQEKEARSIRKAGEMEVEASNVSYESMRVNTKSFADKIIRPSQNVKSAKRQDTERRK